MYELLRGIFSYEFAIGLLVGGRLYDGYSWRGSHYLPNESKASLRAG